VRSLLENERNQQQISRQLRKHLEEFPLPPKRLDRGKTNYEGVDKKKVDKTLPVMKVGGRLKIGPEGQ